MPWVIIAPFGWPVVPEVYMIVETSSWVTRFGLGERRSPRRCARLVGAAGARAAARTATSAQLGDGQRGLGELGIVDHQRGAASPTMKCSSGTVSRLFSGTKIAPSRPQANCSSSVSVVFSASTATRSPRAIFSRVAQMRGKPRNPSIELRVSEAASAAEIDHRRACPACGGRNGRSSRNGEPAKFPPRLRRSGAA